MAELEFVSDAATYQDDEKVAALVRQLF